MTAFERGTAELPHPDSVRVERIREKLAGWRRALDAGRFLNHAQTHNILTRLLDELEEALK